MGVLPIIIGGGGGGGGGGAMKALVTPDPCGGKLSGGSGTVASTDWAAVVLACLLRSALPNARDKDELLPKSSTDGCDLAPVIPVDE